MGTGVALGVGGRGLAVGCWIGGEVGTTAVVATGDGAAGSVDVGAAVSITALASGVPVAIATADRVGVADHVGVGVLDAADGTSALPLAHAASATSAVIAVTMRDALIVRAYRGTSSLTTR